MSQITRIVNKFRGYFVEDCSCVYCLHYGGKKRGCKLTKCCCEEEKRDAIANNRIKRKRGSLRGPTKSEILWERRSNGLERAFRPQAETSGEEFATPWDM